MTNSTSDSIIQNWMQALDQQGKSHLTIETYHRGVKHFAHWNGMTYGSDFDPGAIIPRDVRDWKAHQQTIEKAAPATINQRLVALSSFFRWAVKQNMTHDDPTADVNGLRLPKQQPKGVSRQDLRRVLRTVHASGNVRDIAIIEILAGTGIRVSELLALAVGDIEIKERSGKLTVRRGKHDGFREIPLTKDIRHALSAYLEQHPEKNDPDTPMWVGLRGKLSNRSSIVRVLNKYAYQAEIEAVTPHTLRHTFATRYLEANPDDLRGLAALLGHANLNTVMVYTEPSVEDLEERMERMEFNV
jgi:site-specific recombinase XerD